MLKFDIYKRHWKELAAQRVPSLYHLASYDRDKLELLDMYMRDCLDTFFANQG